MRAPAKVGAVRMKMPLTERGTVSIAVCDGLGLGPAGLVRLNLRCMGHVCVLCRFSWIHGILQARTLKWVAMPSSRGSSGPRD